MTNLLPPQAKKQLVYEYYLRAISVFLLLTTIAILVVIVLFSPSFLFLTLQEANIKNEVGTAVSEMAEVTHATTQIREANTLAQIYATQSEQDLFSMYIEKLKELAGNDVRIISMSISRGDTMHVEQVDFTAIANTRQALINFRDNLNDNTKFGEFSFPIANLSQASNIEFRLSVPVIIDDI